jgi:hypothetical protein
MLTRNRHLPTGHGCDLRPNDGSALYVNICKITLQDHGGEVTRDPRPATRDLMVARPTAGAGA